MLTAIGDVMREMYSRGWISTRDGNASVRKGGKRFFHITPSGVRKNKIEVEQLIRIEYNDIGEMFVNEIVTEPVIDGHEIVSYFKQTARIPIKESSQKPSGELHMHDLLLRSVKKTRAVIHAHPTHCIAAMHAGIKLNEIAKDFPELNRYTRVGPNVPILPVTSVELGNATADALGLVNGTSEVMFDIVGQEAHGVTAVAQNPWDAFEHIERLNHICEIVLLSQTFGGKK